MAEALLLSRALTYSKHSAVISAFGQHFVKTGLFTAEHHASLRKAFDERNIGDYDYSVPFSKEEAAALLERAQRFVDDAESFLRNKG